MVRDAAAAARDDDAFAAAEAALRAATDAAAANLHAMVTTRGGSFAARRLLCVLAGVDVAGAPRRPGAPGDGEAGEPAARARPGAAPARLGAGGAAPRADALAFPDLLRRLSAAVLGGGGEWAGAGAGAAAADPCAGPFLQALLRACAASLGDDGQTARLVVQALGGVAGGGAASLSPDALGTLLTDRAGSHLVEAALEAAPEELLQKLLTAAFRGRLPAMAAHPTANFAVQAALGAVRRPAQLRRMLEDLRPTLAALLRARRGGVAAALAAASGRVGALEADAADALWAAAGALDAAAPSPLHALLALDTGARLGDGTGRRLSPLGCATAVSVMRYPPEACRAWAAALAALTPAELAAVARDPGGARVVEAYLEGAGAAPKKRRAELAALAGAWASIAAASAAGARFVERAFGIADAGGKEAIARELAAAPRLGATPRGAALLRTCRAAELGAGGGEGAWRARAEAADAVRGEFEDIFAEGAGAGAEGADVADALARKAKRKAEKKARKAAEEEEEGDGEAKPKRKKERAAEGEDAAVAMGKKKKRKEFKA